MRIRNVPLGTLVLEFVVVVLGVLIALGVDQAVENRREKELEQAYLNALTSDVESDLAALRQEFLPAIDQREARAREVIEVVEDSGDPDPVRIAVSLDFAGHLSVFEPQRSTFDDLIATGGFRLIRDLRVRSEVVGYYAVSRLNDMHELIRNEIWYEYRPVIDEVLDPIFVAGYEPPPTGGSPSRARSAAAFFPLSASSRMWSTMPAKSSGNPPRKWLHHRRPTSLPRCQLR